MQGKHGYFTCKSSAANICSSPTIAHRSETPVGAELLNSGALSFSALIRGNSLLGFENWRMNACALDLPDEMVADLFTKWIEIPDVGRLDASMLEKSARAKLVRALALVRGFETNVHFNHFLSNKQLFSEAYERFLNWVLKRKTSIKDLIAAPLLLLDEDLLLAVLCRVGQCIQRIDFYDPYEWNPCSSSMCMMDMINVTKFNCPNVESITVGAGIVAFKLRHIIKAWPQLTSLTAMSCGADDSEMNEITEHCEALSHISIPCTVHEKILNFLQCKGSHLQSISRLTFTDGDSIAKYCPMLQSLRPHSGLPLTHELALALKNGCPQLTGLKVEYNFERTTLRALVQLASRLTVLEIESRNYLPEAELLAVLQQCTLLRKLCVNRAEGLTDDTLMVLSAHCRQLRELRLHNGIDDGITDVGITALATGCTELRKLWLSPSSVTGQGLIPLFKACPHLSDLTLNHCACVTDAAWIALPALCPHLTNLTIHSYDETASAPTGLLAVIAGCRKLRKLSVYCQTWTKRDKEMVWEAIRGRSCAPHKLLAFIA